MHPSPRLCPQTTSASTAARAPAATIVSSASYLSTWLTILSFVNEPRSVFFFLFFLFFLFLRERGTLLEGRKRKRVTAEYFREDFNFLPSKILKNRSYSCF